MEFHRFEHLEYAERRPAFPAGRMPVLIALHGAGSRGGTVQQLAEHPLFAPTSLLTQEDSPLLVLMPLCAANSWFDVFEQLQRFVRMVAARPDVDPDRIYLLGISMGGYGAWQLAMTMPEVFAALVPICGGGMYWNADRLKDIPVWAFHGACDDVVLPEESIKMVARLNAIPDGKGARLTVVAHDGHNVWTDALATPELYDWLLAQKKQTGGDYRDDYAGKGEIYG